MLDSLAGLRTMIARGPDFTVLLAVFLVGCHASSSGFGVPCSPALHQPARDAMVERQLIERRITNPAVIAAFHRVPRHCFVPDASWPRAYADQPLPIGYGQTISQPYIVARMTELLALEKQDKVLEVGTGSGYQTAVLAELAGQVWSVEIVPSLARRAATLLSALGYTNVTVRTGDGMQGWPEEGPYQAILLTAASETLPETLLAQMAIGGRLLAPLGGSDQHLVLYRRTNTGYQRSVLDAVRFVPILDEEAATHLGLDDTNK